MIHCRVTLVLIVSWLVTLVVIVSWLVAVEAVSWLALGRRTAVAGDRGTVV